MLLIEKIDTTSKKQVQRFVKMPFALYRSYPEWVPPILVDQEAQLNREKYPFYEHSDADFYIASRDGKDVGRIAAIENKPYNQHHSSRKAQFYFFECENNSEIANRLFDTLFMWARQRGLNTIIGPKGVSPLDGYGILIEGFYKRNMMTMMNFNPPYYQTLFEEAGFTKEVDFISCVAQKDQFHFPERIAEIAERVKSKGSFHIHSFKTIAALKKWSKRIGEAYNKAFINNWEYYPLSQREIDMIVSTLELIADPALIKVIVHENDIVGFLFAFPDAAAAIRRWGGRLLPFGLPDLLIEMRRTRWVAVNTAGVLPEYQGRGGNALLYTELAKTIQHNHFDHAALYQVAETATNMRRDLETIGFSFYKNHRVYQKSL